MKKQIDIQSELEADETLLWRGVPYRGIRFTAQDWFLIPFSVFWCGLVVASIATALTAFFVALPEPSGEQWFPLVFQIPFVIVGYFLLVGRFQSDIRRRKKLYYALTDQRAIIFKAGFNASTRSFVLNKFSNLQVIEKKNGRGTIKFGETGRSNWFGNPVTLLTGAPDGFEFEGIENVREVFDLIKGSQRRSRNARF